MTHREEYGDQGQDARNGNFTNMAIQGNRAGGAVGQELRPPINTSRPPTTSAYSNIQDPGIGGTGGQLTQNPGTTNQQPSTSAYRGPQGVAGQYQGNMPQIQVPQTQPSTSYQVNRPMESLQGPNANQGQQQW